MYLKLVTLICNVFSMKGWKPDDEYVNNNDITVNKVIRRTCVERITDVSMAADIIILLT